MAIWKDHTSAKQAPSPVPMMNEPVRPEPTSWPELAPVPVAVAPKARIDADRPRKESLIAADLTIEGKIEGAGRQRAHRRQIQGRCQRAG